MSFIFQHTQQDFHFQVGNELNPRVVKCEKDDKAEQHDLT